jgi:Lon protease-like protein
VLIRSGREVVDQPDIRHVGTAASLIAETPHPDGRTSIVVRGNRRFRVIDHDWSRGYLTGTVTWLDEPTGDAQTCNLLATQATDLWEKLIRRLAVMVGQQRDVDELIDPLIVRLPADPTARCYDILGQLPIPAGTRQHHMEFPTTEARLASLVDLLESEIRLASAFKTSPSLTYASNRTINPN